MVNCKYNNNNHKLMTPILLQGTGRKFLESNEYLALGISISLEFIWKT